MSCIGGDHDFMLLIRSSQEHFGGKKFIEIKLWYCVPIGTLRE